MSSSPLPSAASPDPDDTPSSLGARLDRLFGEGVDPDITLEGEPPGATRPGGDGDLPPPDVRYRVKGELGRGAQGLVLELWDVELRRRLARKVLLRRGEELGARAGASPRRPDVSAVTRFLQEAQITAQLEHPGVVPVHDLGVDAAGRVHFTMRRVRGEHLARVFERVRAGEDGWSQTRALGVLLKVCEAMAYAHAKGVVHRDLKPANLMVGRFGEVYVMDWGLARVLGRPDARDIRLAGQPLPPSSLVTSERSDADAHDPDSPLRTLDGDVVGTPAYMPPEQARGNVEAVGPRSDVYAVGAILYQLLGGRMPYLEPGTPPSPFVVWHSVLAGPPRPLEELAPDQPPELVAICAKAMAREPERRYSDMQAMAEDLRAFLEDRVVQAYRTGPLVELRKWVARNRAAAAALAALVVVLVSSGFALALTELERSRSAERATRAERERVAEATFAGDEFAASALASRADSLWPIHPDRAPAMRAWLDEARAVVARLPGYREELEGLRARALPVPDETQLTSEDPRLERLAFLREEAAAFESQLAEARVALERVEDGAATDEEWERADFWRETVAILSLELPEVRRRTASLERQLASPPRYRLDDEPAQRRLERLTRLVGELEELAGEDDGLIAAVELRLERAATLAQRTTEGPAARAAWDEASASIADRARCPLYDGLEVTPQLGLLPLRRDPDSGLWEFWHVLSGARPEVGEDGRYVLTPDTGVVLVLIPGGRFAMGADWPPLGRETQDEASRIYEGPVHDVALDPYFLAKHELTQGQWLALDGSAPANFEAGYQNSIDPRYSRLHPVEHVTWDAAWRALRRVGLEIPTEARWERAARADDGGLVLSAGRPTLSGPELANLWGQSSDKRFLEPWTFATEEADAFHVSAPVGCFPPNPYGLHDMAGNVSEWCRDWVETEGYREKLAEGEFSDLLPTPGDGEHRPSHGQQRAVRGGSFLTRWSEFTLTLREGHRPDGADVDIGVRPARSIVRP